ncbi:hypothetical protein [uncultured Cyclobacterium sp.]|uniref:hypothetical protein n=1 Tax=uncultured Cyclobacterium sp. TaxID=453820 RepID=UPI0030EE7803
MDYLDKGILVQATMEMAKRKKGNAFCPTEVLKWIYPTDWQSFLDEEYKAVNWLHEKGCIALADEGKSLSKSVLEEDNKIKLGSNTFRL